MLYKIYTFYKIIENIWKLNFFRNIIFKCYYFCIICLILINNYILNKYTTIYCLMTLLLINISLKK